MMDIQRSFENGRQGEHGARLRARQNVPMHPNWTVRATKPGDARIVAIHRYPDPDADAIDLDAYAAWLVPMLERGGYVGFIAEAQGRVVGGAGGVLLEWGPSRGDRSSHRARIVNVFTDPEWRRRGVARQLLEAVIARCAQRGVQTYVLSSTFASSKLYEELGFKAYPTEMILRHEFGGSDTG